MSRALLFPLGILVLALAHPVHADARATLRARRLHHLDVLRAYREGGVFPLNTTIAGEGHFLVDPRGTLCAVANLIAEDGHRELVAQAARKNNALLFADVKEGALFAWILASGFTQEEIARIQVPSDFVLEMPASPERAPRPDLVAAARKKVTAYLAAVERALRGETEAGLDLALRRLGERPDLGAALALAR